LYAKFRLHKAEFVVAPVLPHAPIKLASKSSKSVLRHIVLQMGLR